MERKQWKSEAGPRQTKDVDKALRSLRTHFDTVTEIKDWGRMNVVSFRLDGTQAEKANAVLAELGERFAWTITRANCKAVLAAVEEAKRANPIPEIDNRTKVEGGAS